ncbi:molybdopterin-dependent oxidoreductase [Pseudodesulfovibrio sp. JC047]|uniref:molybdopterin-dependent aldehyde oxidoreductase n=1 Tax=Pseudodesulfovibrio sp. JC047 TaxID=2683199 RepID=UPI0013D41870|nr:molybdopterin-dependent aldehyde oxidoreductase [Pseudodesulfovibrio sp. JC047]NDV19868.1 molybdopterin-dependent oxidoreductase [Pseudodesulfovibrio sp. JC047]
MIKRTLMVNGIARQVVCEADESLANVLRENLGLTSVKVGCNTGQCGSCSIIKDGKLIRSCTMKMKRVKNGSKVMTLEGLGTPDNLHPIQLAWIAYGGAQCGFCSPGFLMSTYALLGTNPKPTREEVRDWFQKHRNACRCTGYKPLVDAVMAAAEVLRGDKSKDDLIFKIPEDGRIWGTNYPRPSAVAKVTGTWDFGADVGLRLPPGTLQCQLVQAEVSHAKILSIDTSEAEAVPGVYKVVTAQDVKGKNRITGLITFPSNKGDGWDRPILCDEKVFQYGDALAIVCADTLAAAKEGAAKVKVELEQLPEYMSAPAAMADDAMEIHPGTPNVYYEQKVAKGEDTAPIFEKADVVIEGDYYTQRQPHMPIEPDVGFAYMDEDKLVIHSKSIGIHLHLYMIAPGLGMEPEKMVLVQNPTGGTFGYKFSPTMEALVGAAAMATGRPVYLNYTWKQQQTYTGKRSPQFTTVRMAATKEGKLLGMETDWTVDHGPYSEFGDLLTLRGAQYIGAGYDIPAIRGEGRTVCTNHCWGAAFRGYGAPEAEFPSEVLMDELAEKLGMDPLDLRYKNVYRKGSTTPTGQDPEVYSLPEMIDRIRPKYAEAKKQAAEQSTDAIKRGVGISVGVYGSGLDGPDTAEVDIALNEDNTVTVFTAWGDHGQGADMGTLGTAHEALRPMNLSPDQIHLVMGDTSLAPNAGPAGGSRSQVVVGQATKNACDLLVAAMKKKDGTFRTYEEMVAEELDLRYNGKWTAPANDCDENGQGNPFCCYMYGVFLSQVAVDVATGKTTVEKMVTVADIGVVNNYLLVDGQIHGGVAQGIGLALSEDYEDIKKHSTMVGAGLPYIKQIPDDMEIIYVETPRPDGPFGASGVGEMPLTAPHAAIINAIYNACGARIRKLPAYPEKVLAAMKV